MKSNGGTKGQKMNDDQWSVFYFRLLFSLISSPLSVCEWVVVLINKSLGKEVREGDANDPPLFI